MSGLILTLLSVTALGAAPTAAPDTAVVCPAELRPALEPWLALRTEQGRRIALIEPRSAEQIKSELRRIAEGGSLRWVLLVGDVDDPVAGRARSTPTNYRASEIIARWGPDKFIATDNPYADLDGDEAPDLAVGRLTADSPEELATIVRKIIEYEQAPPRGLWRQKINFIAGVGGFGAIVDSVLEYTTKRFLTDGIPPAYTTTMTYGSWRSPFCPDPRRFHDVAVQRLNEGCLFWVYIGHGQRRYLDRVQVPGGAFHILDVNDMPKLRAETAPPIAIFLACYTGAFDGELDCLAEEMLRAPGGPVAVLSGSRVTMPYAMAVMGSSMMHEYFHEQRATLGELLMHTKRRMITDEGEEGDHFAQRRQLLDALAAALSPHGDRLRDERLEHVALFNLLGDPLLTLRRPASVEVTTDEVAVAGSSVQLRVRSPVQGRATIELVCRRDASRHEFSAREAVLDPDALELWQRDYERANDYRWATRRVDLIEPEALLEFEIPSEVTGPCYLRCYIEGEAEDALGAAAVFVQPIRTAAMP